MFALRAAQSSHAVPRPRTSVHTLPMDATQIMRGMAHNNAWSNLRLHRAIGELSADEYRATRTSFFPSLHLTLSHILFVDFFYVDALEGGDRGVAVRAEQPVFEQRGTFAELREMQRAVDLRLIACSVLPLDDEIRLQRIDYVQAESRANVLL